MSIGICCIGSNFTGAAILAIVLAYVVKFFWFENPPDTWDSWRWDEEFYYALSITGGAVFLTMLVHYVGKVALHIWGKCCGPCCCCHNRRRPQYVPLQEV